MSIAYSIAQRTPSLNSVFAGLACALALALTAGPALAETTGMERVEIHGRVVEAPVRYDIHASCHNLEGQLMGALEKTWLQANRYGDVNVQLVVENGRVSTAHARGISPVVAHEVRRAVGSLDCSVQQTAEAQVYRFNVEFVDPYQPRPEVMQGAVAIASPMSIRVAQINP